MQQGQQRLQADRFGEQRCRQSRQQGRQRLQADLGCNKLNGIASRQCHMSELHNATSNKSREVRPFGARPVYPRPQTKSLSTKLDNEERKDTTCDGTRTDCHLALRHTCSLLGSLPSARSTFCSVFLWLSLCLALYLSGSREARPVHPPPQHHGRKTTTRTHVMKRIVNLKRDHKDSCTLLVSVSSAILWK